MPRTIFPRAAIAASLLAFLGLSACGTAPSARAADPVLPETPAARAERECKAGADAACLDFALGLLTKAESAPRAYQLLHDTCARSHAESCRWEALLLREGRGVAKDPSGAVRVLERGCTLGAFRACGDLASALFDAAGVGRDEKRAFTLNEAACTQGYEVACFNLGVALETGRTGGANIAGPSQASGVDVPRARVSYIRACDLGQVDGCHRAGLFAEKGLGGAVDPVAAFGLYVKAWQKGHRDACLAAARLRMSGRATWGADVDVWDGRLYEAACTLGDQAVCVQLGWLLWEGKGVAKSPERALTLGRAACGTIAEGCALAGYARVETAGEGAVGDPARRDAVALFERGCTAGSGLACAHLGVMIARCEGVACDAARAKTLLTKACGDGEAFACDELASVLADGTPAERAQAEQLATKSCAAGNQDACTLKAELLAATQPADALALFEKGCTDKRAESCFEAGVLLEGEPLGDTKKSKKPAAAVRSGLTPNPVTAGERYLAGCNLGHVPSCAAASRLFRAGAIVPQGADGPKWLATFYETVCTLGDPPSCGTLAIVLFRGLGVDVDRDRARKVGLDACNAQDATGCLVAGAVGYENRGNTGKPGIAASIELLVKGCDLGDLEACAWAGIALTGGLEPPYDEARGKKLLASACKAELKAACKQLEAVKKRQANQRDAEREGAACERGDRKACRHAADLWGVVDSESARRKPLYERGCELGDGAACTGRGKVDAWDRTRSTWFQKGCDHGDGAGCRELAQARRRGPKEPGDWWAKTYQRGCELRDGRSCGYVASTALYGWDGHSVDKAEGERMFKHACELGSEYDCHLLAELYKNGDVLKKDLGAYERYHKRACDLGYVLGCGRKLFK